eukprot:1849146-Pyramimonas_sp.AAC.1
MDCASHAPSCAAVVRTRFLFSPSVPAHLRPPRVAPQLGEGLSCEGVPCPRAPPLYTQPKR